MGQPLPGPYSCRFHPWAREIHDSSATYHWIIKAAQLGLTEVALNRVFYTLDVLKRDVLYVLPSGSDASDFSKSRFTPAINQSSYLRGLFTSLDSVSLKQAGSQTLYIRGSRSHSKLKSVPVGMVVLDELDEMSPRSINLALERLSGQFDKTVWGISTPTIPNFGIHQKYQESTQEHFFFNCPSCNRLIELTWPDSFEIRGEGAHDPRCYESYIKCNECKAKLPHEAKQDFLAKGRWIATEKSASPDIRGSYINQLYSSTVHPGDITVAFFHGQTDELANQEFYNSKLGLPFISDGARLDDSQIDDVVGSHSLRDPRPKSAGRLITLGADQGKSNYVTICEWFVDGFASDINTNALCRVLHYEKFSEDEWGRFDELMREWQVLAAVIDADPQINEARKFARRYPKFVWLCRYRRGQVGREVSVSEEDRGAPIITVDRTSWIGTVMSRFKAYPPRISFPRELGYEYREHLKNIVRTNIRDPDTGDVRATYIRTGPDHYAHSLVYAELALPFAAVVETGRDIKHFV
jgi:hypothetical protein